MIPRLLVLLFIFSSFASIAQKNFEEALIVINSGDTIRGFINNNDWKKNPQVINYKNSDDRIINYTPLEIQAFYLTKTQEWYKSAVLELNKNSLKEADVIKNRNQKGTQLDTVFLRLLVKGKISLYYLNDESSRPHFIIEKGGLLQELKMERKRVSIPKEGIVNLEYFKRQLTEQFADCPNGKFDVSRSKYTEGSLTPLILSYNRCFSSEDTYVRSTEKAKMSISIIAGANYSSVTVNGTAYSTTEENYKADVTPFAGFSFDLIFPRNRKSLSLNNDLIYRYYSIEDLFEASQIKLLTTLRYRFPSAGSARFFLGGGFTNALILSAESLPAGTSNDYRKHEQGFTLETGIVAKRLSYLLRYERTNGFSPYSETSTNFTVLYAGIGFKLNK